MVIPKHHDWVAFQMLHFSVLSFYCQQAKIFLLKSGFMICFFCENSNISLMNFHSQPQTEQMLGEKKTYEKEFLFLGDKHFL